MELVYKAIIPVIFCLMPAGLDLLSMFLLFALIGINILAKTLFSKLVKLVLDRNGKYLSGVTFYGLKYKNGGNFL